MKKIIHNLNLRVYFEDTDAGGVVYHANYLNFCERARTELLRQSGFSQSLLIKANIAFVVNKINIIYQRPARLDDELLVTTELIKLTGASLTFKQTIFCNGIELVIADVVVACVDLIKMKARSIPKDIRFMLE